MCELSTLDILLFVYQFLHSKLLRNQNKLLKYIPDHNFFRKGYTVLQ